MQCIFEKDTLYPNIESEKNNHIINKYERYN